MGMACAIMCMDEGEIERLAQANSLERFKDSSGRDGADGSLILADALTYAAGATAVITALLDAYESGWTFSAGAIVMICAGFGLWICSQSLNDFRRLIPVWLRIVLGMRVLPKTFEDQSLSARRRRMWTMVVAAALSSIIAVQFSLRDTILTRSSVPFHLVLWLIVLLDLAVAVQWGRLISRSGRIQDRPGGWRH